MLGGCGDKDAEDSASGSDGGSGDESGADEGGSGEGGSDEGGDDGGSDGDVYAQTACSLLSGELTSIEAASSADEASQALIVPSETEAWRVEGEGSDRYLMVEIEDWMVTVRIFATDGIRVSFLGGEQSASQAENEACSGYSDQSIIVHEWGSYVVHLEGEGDVEISVIQEPSKE